MKDFYSLYAYFNSIDSNPMDGNAKAHDPVLSLPSEEERAKQEAIQEKIKAARKTLMAPHPAADAQQDHWESAIDGVSAGGEVKFGKWYQVGPFEAKSKQQDYLFKNDFGPESTKFERKQSFDYQGKPLKWKHVVIACLLYTSPSPRDATLSRMPSSA